MSRQLTLGRFLCCKVLVGEYCLLSRLGGVSSCYLEGLADLVWGSEVVYLISRVNYRHRMTVHMIVGVYLSVGSRFVEDEFPTCFHIQTC